MLGGAVHIPIVIAFLKFCDNKTSQSYKDKKAAEEQAVAEAKAKADAEAKAKADAAKAKADDAKAKAQAKAATEPKAPESSNE